MDIDYDKIWPDLPVKYLVLATANYIVFIDHENDLDWKTSEEFDKRNLSEKERVQFNQISNEVANIETIPCDNLDEKVIINFKRQIGEALIRNFDNDFVNAQKMILLAKTYISDRNSQESRFLYLKSSIITTLISLFIASSIWLLRSSVVESIGQNTFWFTISFFVGSFGALLSIILRMGKTNLDFHASKKLHYTEGFSKIFAGMTSALIMALCIKSGIFLNAVVEKSDSNLILVLSAMVAGASERLVPSIIKKIETAKIEDNE